MSKFGWCVTSCHKVENNKTKCTRRTESVLSSEFMELAKVL